MMVLVALDIIVPCYRVLPGSCSVRLALHARQCHGGLDGQPRPPGGNPGPRLQVREPRLGLAGGRPGLPVPRGSTVRRRLCGVPGPARHRVRWPLGARRQPRSRGMGVPNGPSSSLRSTYHQAVFTGCVREPVRQIVCEASAYDDVVGRRLVQLPDDGRGFGHVGLGTLSGAEHPRVKV